MVLIIGAGITGLTAACDLVRRGVSAILVEASARAGGLIYTEQSGQYTIETGADSMLAQKPAGLELCDELGLASQLQDVRPPGGAFVLRGTRLFAIPKPSRLGIPLTWGTVARYDLLPVIARARLAIEPWIPARRASDDESVASFFRRRFGTASVDLIAQPLLGGIHAGDIEQLSMRALFPKLLDAERRSGHVMRRTADRDPLLSEQSGESAGGAFRSLRGGMGTLISALQRDLGGDHLLLQTPIDRLERTDGGWRAATRGRAFDAQAVVLAIPAHVAARLLKPIDAEAARLCDTVPYVSTASVALAWPRSAIAHGLSGTGFVVARRHSDVRITACTWVSSKWEGRAPEDVALLRAFIGGAHDPHVVDLTDEEIVAVAQRDLGRVLGITSGPVFARVHRWRGAGAQHTVGHLFRMNALDERLRELPGLFVAGSGFRSIGIPDCIADARRIAAAVRDYVRRQTPRAIDEGMVR
jgi:oxygen-dependent protoporphyrinogen oxidase